ncbi:CpsD/CapB family tyrosine-protein kinase [Clostridium sp. D53t1_180928_C8]|uniref:CpsD/CapB family tyrosine-protein kinase n=1 Tax=Clostridium sp. D53t1_180928_C8 TaxID=2787101 RepID=UPI0018A8AC27|nr:CpsD/CapB family tyrosine-protein kinase [Clostridium sp. D53t1_180928_C8]
MFIVERKPKSIAAEAYRSLRTNIQYSSFDKKYQTLVVTSANPGEGKSTVSGNLALVLAQGESKVLLVDCDMRKPSMHKKFRVTNTYGISDLLVGKQKLETVVNKVKSNLSIITAGNVPPNPAEMLASKAMASFLEEMKKEYDYIVLDTPPLQAVADAQILSTKVDGTLIVVRAGATKKDDVHNSVSILKKVNGHIIGTVLNAAENKKDKYYYHYGDDNSRTGRRVNSKK